MHCKGSSRENTINRYGPPVPGGGKYRPMSRGMGRYDEETGGPPPMHHMHMMGPPMGPPLMNSGAPPPPMMMGPPVMGPPPVIPPPPQPPAVPLEAGAPPPNPECDMKELNKMFGMTASDIDKYSRVIFPVTFTCFQLMYWIIYQHLSDHVVDDLVYLHPD